MYLHQIQKLRKVHRYCFIFLCTAIVFFVFFPLTAKADFLGFETYDVFLAITKQSQEVNSLMEQSFKFCSVSPFAIVNVYMLNDHKLIAMDIMAAVKTTSLVVATLLLMVDFAKKTTSFEWASKWENILIFLVKIILIKQVCMNSDAIISSVYSLFHYINREALSAVLTEEFLPTGNMHHYNIQVTNAVFDAIHDAGGILKSWIEVYMLGWETLNVDVMQDNPYDISQDAVKVFYPNAAFPDTDAVLYNSAKRDFAANTGNINFSPTYDLLTYVIPFFLIMKALALLIFAMTIGRIFELALYTFFAPLPLATFAGEGTHEVGKTFLKSYIACVLQIAVIVVMFLMYFAMQNFFKTSSNFSATRLWQIVCLATLGMSIFKSGTWARQVCGL